MTGQQIKQIIIPTPLQAVVSLLIAAVLIAVVYASPIAAFVTHQSNITTDVLQTSYQTQLANLNQFKGLQTLVTGVFWAAVGLVAYVAYLVLLNAFISLRNEVVVETQYTNKGSVLPQLVRTLTHAAIAGALVLALILTGKLLVPYFLGLVEASIYNNSGWWWGIIGWLGLSLDAYAIWILAQLAIGYE
jgi:hypothetical protein